ncbi:4-hydroxy-3-methylbut-2-enyl diphosphate reductase [Crocinitomix catalasitica]|uniref:4-hydroxy-3-methylbut-2-enyl diphosphate reductase n=1 Tax=Crocinitomix catalasitica TaxID=184607 RepID=UPI00068783C0|nr:4-hydroxy-3-methylbut-2-enyl diphosphate reductase [Crocinitomix catalasitica]
MKQFDIPLYYRSPIISRVKAIRSNNDNRKKDFSPTLLNFDGIQFVLARHFGFCFGVENAIEISYRALAENPDKRIFLLSQMIHNPSVNADLEKNGIEFIQDTQGNQLKEWDEIHPEDVVIIPAFGTTIEIESILEKKGIETKKYNTTCPFVERVWNKSEKLGNDDYTVIIHGKDKHEETRATFSHAKEHAKSIVLRDIEEAKILGEIILGKRSKADFAKHFSTRTSEGLNFETDFDRIGVVNQTTMLASETQEISDYLADIMNQKFGSENKDQHFANTRDTLCYATNDNQTATLALLEEDADVAFVIGGYNSSNTSHLVELLEKKFKTYYIKDETELIDKDHIHHYDLHQNKTVDTENYLPTDKALKIIITSGASCPDSTVDRVIQRLGELQDLNLDVESALTILKNNFK